MSEILRQFVDKTTNLLIPTQATLELTYRCNERCGHCYLATYNDLDDGRPPLTKEEWFKVLDQLADAGTLILVLIGGEPMMHPHFWDIATYAGHKNFAVTIITNGTLIDATSAARLARLGVYNVTLSLYSLRPDTHDQMTGHKNSHQKLMSAIDHLIKNKITVGLNCLLTSRNIDTYFELEDWAKLHDLTIRPDPLITAKNDGSLASTEQRASREQLIRYYREKARRGAIAHPMDLSDDHAPVCNAGRSKCAVNPYGDLLTCLEVRESVGNLREHDFQTLWHSNKANRIRSLKNKDLAKELRCDNGEHCDHCPGMAAAETGDPTKPVPFLMEVAEIKAKYGAR